VLAVRSYTGDTSQGKRTDLRPRPSKGSAAIQIERNQLLSQQDLYKMASEVGEAIGISKLENTDWADIKTADRATLRQPIAQQYQASFACTMKNFSFA
jgi:hypothetical protein